MRRLLVAVVVLLSVGAPSAVAAPEHGLNVAAIETGGADDMMAALEGTGSRWSRHFLLWDQFEPQRGQLDAGLVDAYRRTMDREAAIGVKTMLTVLRAPAWANGSSDPSVPPADPQDFASFLGRLAERFAGRVEVIELWNEPDESIFWHAPVDAARYTRLVQAAYPAIKQADPQIKVAFGPTTGSNYTYLEQAYAAGAKGFFDAVSVHTDTACSVAPPTFTYRLDGRLGQYTFLGYREVRATMLAHGDDKPIYLSEMGWSTTSARCDRGVWAQLKPAGVSEEVQADYLRQAMHCLREDPYVQIAIWFEARDRALEDSELTRYGLLRPDGTEKPAYAALRDYARHGDRLAGPCGDFVAPRIVIRSPGTERRVYDRLVLHAETPDRDVARMSFVVNGRTIENFTPNLRAGETVRDYLANPARRDWQGVRRLPFGEHTLTVQAKDTSGNVAEQSLRFVRVDPSTLPSQRTRFGAVRMTGRGAARAVTGRLLSPGLDFGIAGKVQVAWEVRRGGGWARVHGATANANAPFRFRQRLRRSGAWRVRVQYRGTRPYRSSASRWMRFRVG